MKTLVRLGDRRREGGENKKIPDGLPLAGCLDHVITYLPNLFLPLPIILLPPIIALQYLHRLAYRLLSYRLSLIGHLGCLPTLEVSNFRRLLTTVDILRWTYWTHKGHEEG